MKPMSTGDEPRHLTLVAPTETAPSRLTRAQVASRLGVSISTVRRYEGVRLHPEVDASDVRWFQANEVAALAASLANEPRMRNGNRAPAAPKPEARSPGELAALVFERLEQRQSLAEIVIGLRIEPDAVRALFDAWCLGLTEAQLLTAREPHVPRESDVPRMNASTLAERLTALPAGQPTRISVARSRGSFLSNDVHFAHVAELGGFQVSGPCGIDEITRRYGGGDYRVTAYGFDPPGVRWELLVESLTVAPLRSP
jgi:transcriptional regulator with XRE-family HTH domain